MAAFFILCFGEQEAKNPGSGQSPGFYVLGLTANGGMKDKKTNYDSVIIKIYTDIA